MKRLQLMHCINYFEAYGEKKVLENFFESFKTFHFLPPLEIMLAEAFKIHKHNKISDDKLYLLEKGVCFFYKAIDKNYAIKKEICEEIKNKVSKDLAPERKKA